MSIAHLGVDVAILKVATSIEMERQQQLLNPIQRADTSSSSQAPKRSTGRGVPANRIENGKNARLERVPEEHLSPRHKPNRLEQKAHDGPQHDLGFSGS